MKKIEVYSPAPDWTSPAHRPQVLSPPREADLAAAFEASRVWGRSSFNIDGVGKRELSKRLQRMPELAQRQS